MKTVTHPSFSHRLLQPAFAVTGLLTLAALLPLGAQTTPAAKPAVPAPATPAPAAAAPTADGVLGKIGEEEITVAEIRKALSGLGDQEAAAVNADPNLLNQVVRSLLVQRILLNEAMQKGWDKQPAVQAQLDRVRESAITETYLQSICTPPATYPSEAELKAAYEANKAKLLVAKSFRVAQIFIPVPKDATKEVAAKAQAKLEEVKKALAAKDADFAKIAAAHSEEAQSASRGGEIGWLLETQIQPEIRAELPKLAKDAISEPIRMDDGVHIVKVLDIREPFTPTLEQVHNQLGQQMRKEMTQANSQAYLQKLMKDNPVVLNELALSQVLKKAGN